MLAALVCALVLQVSPPDKNQKTVTLTALEIVQWAGRESDRKFVFETNLGLEHKEVAVPNGLLKKDRAYETTLLLLKTVGIAAIPEKDSSIVQLSNPHTAGKRTLTVYTSAKDLPKADEFCTLTLQVEHASPRYLQATLINLATFPQGVLSDENAGQLILIDYSSNLRRMATIVAATDVPRPVRAYLMEAAVLEGRSADAAAIPDEFAKLDLAKITGKNRFQQIALGSVRLTETGPTNSIQLAPSPDLTLACRASIGGHQRISLRSLTLRATGDKPGRMRTLLETSCTVAAGGWTLIGTAAGIRDNTVLAVVLRIRKLD